MNSAGRAALVAIAGLLLAGSQVGCGPAPCVSKGGIACIWAGNGQLGFNGDNKPLRESRMYWPVDLEFSPDGTPYVLDWNNHRIRKVEPNHTFKTVVGSFVGDGPPDLSDLHPPGAPGTDVSLNHPTDILFTDDGALLFAAWHNHKLRRLDVTTGLVTVVAGAGVGFRGDGGPLSNALFNQPKSLVRAPDGSIYVLDQRNERIRRYSPGGNITTVVGTGTAGFGGDGGPPTSAMLSFEAGPNPEPSGAIALAPDGTLYIADSLNHRIRRVDFALNTIATVAGTGTPGDSGDGGPALQAQLNNPRDLEFGPDGRLYIADTENHRIRALDPVRGSIETIAGTGEAGLNGEGLTAKALKLQRPFGIAFDAGGTLYVADTFNSRILEIRL